MVQIIALISFIWLPITIYQRYTNRKKWYIKGNRRTGVRVKFSSKNRLPIKATVYTNAYFAKLQEDGGIKAPKAGKVLAVPTDRAPKRIWRSDGIHIAKQNAKVFVSRRGVFQRMSKNKVKTLFTWARNAKVNPALRFELTARVTAKRWFNIYFKRRIDAALKTAKL